ncbi:MAG: type II secretion system protein [Candidatus Gracilibacteria bacterium]
MQKKLLSKKGFTLIEVLLVVAIIAILAGIVILAINPSKQLADTRNDQRRSDVRTILDAAYQYSIDNNGTMPVTIGLSPTEICRSNVTCTGGLVDLAVLTTNEKYLVSMPIDPIRINSGDNATGYTIFKTANNRLTVTSYYAESGASITVTR